MAPAWRNSYLRYKTYFLNISSQYSKKEDFKMFIELLLSLATISIFAIFAIKPTLITIVQLYKEIGAKKAVVTQLDEKIKNLNAAQQTSDREKEKIAILDIAIPSQPNPDSFVHQLEGVIAQNPVDILTINVGGATLLGASNVGGTTISTLVSPMPEDAIPLGFSMSASSAYPNLAAFIGGLDKLRRPLKIDGLSITSSTSAEGPELIIVVNGRTPYLMGNMATEAQ